MAGAESVGRKQESNVGKSKVKGPKRRDTKGRKIRKGGRLRSCGSRPLDFRLSDFSTYTLARVVQAASLNRIGNVNELIGAAVFLASDAGSYTSGAVIQVDGAMVI